MEHQNIEIKPLTKEIIRDNISGLIELSRQINHDYWQLEHYLADLDKKWELSSIVLYKSIICGFIIVSAKAESLHINRIAVSADFQKTGIGKLLIEKAARDTEREQKKHLTLKVDSANSGAINFYKKLNFEITGSQDELLLMRLKINK